MNASDPIRHQSEIAPHSDSAKTVIIDITIYELVSISIDVPKIISSIVN